MSLPASLKAQLAAAPSPTRQQLMWRTVAGTVVGVGIVTALFLRGAGPSVGGRQPTFVWAVAFILLSLAARALAAGVSTSMWSVGAKRLVAMPYVALTAIAIAYGSGMSLPHSFDGDMHCCATTVLFSAIVGLCLITARRGTEPIRPGLKALLLGSFAAAIGGALVFLACPLEQPVHFLLGHLGGALLIGGALGLAATKLIATK